MKTNTAVDQKNDKGFTLVELLIVIVILGILATVTVFAVQGITDKGKTSTCAADKKTYEVAVEAYWAQNGSYPTADTQLTGANGFLRDVSANYDVKSDGSGAIVVQSGSPAGCTV